MAIKDKISKYFDVRELVCPHVYNTFGQYSWTFLDDRLLETLLVIREALGRPITVNNWHTGGALSQRGLRCNVCRLVKEKTDMEKVYLTAHTQGTGIDFDVQGMSAQSVREWLLHNQDLLPRPIRLEAGVTWVHLDLRNDGSEGGVIYFTD